MSWLAGPSIARYAQDSLQQALLSLKDNRLRTVLSMLGVAVGVAAVLVVGTITKSGREYIFSELESYGLNTIWLYRQMPEDNPFAAVTPGAGITSEDLASITRSGCCPAILRFSPVVYNWVTWQEFIRVGSFYAKVRVEGVDLEYFPINREQISLGRAFRADDIEQRKNVVIIGSKIQERFFGSHSNPIGEHLRLGDMRLTVVGVLKPKNRSFLMSIGAETLDANDRILIPYTLYQQLMGSKDVQTLVAEARDNQSVEAGSKQLVNFLHRQHNNKFQYREINMLRWIETANDLLQKITLMGVVAAALSLFVGGIGIMNIMSTSVVERTREIGIRKAIGARNRDILTQFLLESAFISTLGGLIGLTLGGTFGYLLTAIANIPLTPSWLIATFSLLLAVGVGVGSGYYPARRAASLRPVEALRYE